MMVVLGYARVSTLDQNLSIQEKALLGARCEIVHYEKFSGTSTMGRAEIRKFLDFVCKSDELVITRIDRLDRSIVDLEIIVRELKYKGC
jgi:DNA invertase Pin-like site-specific DNA recombinase